MIQGHASFKALQHLEHDIPYLAVELWVNHSHGKRQSLESTSSVQALG